MSWKLYKLLYSHFFGYSIKCTDFDDDSTFQSIVRTATLIQVVGIYLPLILVCIIGLASYSWGDQFYVMVIENIIISIVMIICHAIEFFMMKKMMFADKERRRKEVQHRAYMGLDDPEPYDSRNRLLGVVSKRACFTELAVCELLDEFGGRYCKSVDPRLVGHCKFSKEFDPRKVRSYPMSPGLRELVDVDDPPKPMGPILLNNCYHEPKPKCELVQLSQLEGRGRNKACQVGGMFADDLLRLDAELVTGTILSPASGSASKQKRGRGRKNRYFEQIDKEDHAAGAILDDDDEGEAANRKARADHLQAIREEEDIPLSPVVKDEVKAVIEE